MAEITIAAVQMSCTDNRKENLEKASDMVVSAAKDGARIILLPELFETKYFCQERNYAHYNLASSPDSNPAIEAFGKICREYGIVVPVSFFEKDGNSFYNSTAVIDDSGDILGLYRKLHIPDDHFYQEKFYFSPGNLGHKIWKTRFGTLGIGICWDQWFPETARIMTLMGADILMYPTAIGSEPILDVDSMPHWRRTMTGHAACNIIPLVAANRVGTETVTPCEDNGGQASSLTFYGSSFITDETGDLLISAGRDEETVIKASVDLEKVRALRQCWGLFRDRRPETYSDLAGS